jgi:hypothetical protein
MKYALMTSDGGFEVREDNYPLVDGSIVLTDAQYSDLIEGTHIVQDGAIVINPNPKVFI